MQASVKAPLKIPVVGVNISATSYNQVASVALRWVEQVRTRADGSSVGRARMVCVTSVHGIMLAFADRNLRAVLNSADIATPDGMPIVWALRSFQARDQQRVYGPDLMLDICRAAAERGHGIFLYGGRESTLELLRRNLETRFPGIRISGAYSPPFRPLTEAENELVTRMIRESGARFVFVGISTPKQERWMAAQRENLPGVVMFGVGAAFDFHAGVLRQAPAWMQRRGLEWLFRLAMEPLRLWKRYLLVTPLFLPLWALQKAGVLRFARPAMETE